MNFKLRHLGLVLILNTMQYATESSGSNPQQQMNNAENQEKKESQPKEMDSVIKQHYEVIKSACGKFIMDDKTSEFLYDTAPQEIRDFIEINRRISNLKNEENRQLMNKVVPRRLLLIGPPGVGKTTLANVIATKLKRRCYFLRTLMLGTEYQNSDSANLIRFISYVLSENVPTIIILDEINIFATKKYLMGEDMSIAASLWLLLDKCADNPNIIIIGTCNSAEELAPQLKDRFEGSIIRIDHVSTNDRFRILFYYILNFNHDCSMKYLRSLAKKTKNCSPRQLEALINSAYQQSILRLDEPLISEQDLEKAYSKFVISSEIMNSRWTSIKKWLKDNGPLISATAGTINLGILACSFCYFLIKGDPGHLLKPYR